MVFVFVSCASTPIFASPDSDSEQIDELLYGDAVEITDRKRNFLKIITDYGYIGWINDNSVCDFESEPTDCITAPFADLLKTERYFYPPRLTLPFGAKVEIISEGARFAACKTPTGEFYINKNLISPIENKKSESELRKSVSETAKAFLGVQYRWGGRTMAGIDCSGLCFNAYRFNGINIWRDADITASPNIKRIGYKNARLGDLMFFKGHIAMYLGGGKIIHSSASAGGVVIENVENNDYLKEIYICTGTVFNE